MTFKEIASNAIGRGLTIIPLLPKSKQAVEKGWQTKGYSDLSEIDKFPEDYGAGALCSKTTTWILDIDCVDWFMDNFPKELYDDLKTFAVLTGGGGYQFHFKQDDLSREVLDNKSLKNPNKDRYHKPTGAECEAVFDILWDKHQGLLPGCIHPVTGKEYKVHRDTPLICASEAVVEWVLKHLAKPTVKKSENETSPFKLNPTFAIDKELAEHGLKWVKEEREGKIFYNYHAAYGKCLVRGESHAGQGEDPNPRQSAFVHNPANGHFYHQCFSAGCEIGIQSTKKALAALEIDWKKVFLCDGQKTIRLRSFNDIEKLHIQYLWPGYLPYNKLVHFAGGSTEGKSPVTVDLISRVSAGAPWPDGTPNTFGPKHCIILASEDDPHDTVRPRLEVAGANLSLVHTAECSIIKNMTEIEKTLAFDTDMEELIRRMKETSNLGLVVIDPITNYLGKLNMNSEPEVRSILMPLSTAAADLGCCIVTVGHLNKRDKGTSPKQRIMGAAAFHGVSRFLYLFGPDPEEADKYSHIMVQDRGVGSQTLRYKTMVEKLSWDGMESDVVKVKWQGFSTATAEDAVDPNSNKDKSEVEEASEILKKFLYQGRKLATECMEMLKEAGFPIQDGPNPGLNGSKVRNKAKVESKKDGKVWYWFLKAGYETPQNMDF